MPRRSFTVPAAYRRHVEASIALAMDEIARDRRHRIDGEGVLPDFLVDPEEQGTATFTVTIDETPEECRAVRVDGVAIRAA